MSRRIFVGDIQGCRDELARLLDELRFDTTRDELCPVGDVVNRGPDSLGTLRLLHEIGASGVLGNHELHLLRVVAGERTSRPSDTFGDVLAAPDRAELLAWLAAWPFIREWPDVILVHAGLHPAWTKAHAPTPLSLNLREATALSPGDAGLFATTVRYCGADGNRPSADWPPPGEPFRPWFEFFPGHPGERRTVVFGHWARLGIVKRPQVRGLDSGCVWGRELTAWIAEDDRWISIPAARAHSSHD